MTAFLSPARGGERCRKRTKAGGFRGMGVGWGGAPLGRGFLRILAVPLGRVPAPGLASGPSWWPRLLVSELRRHSQPRTSRPSAAAAWRWRAPVPAPSHAPAGAPPSAPVAVPAGVYTADITFDDLKARFNQVGVWVAGGCSRRPRAATPPTRVGRRPGSYQGSSPASLRCLGGGSVMGGPLLWRWWWRQWWRWSAPPYSPPRSLCVGAVGGGGEATRCSPSADAPAGQPIDQPIASPCTPASFSLHLLSATAAEPEGSRLPGSGPGELRSSPHTSAQQQCSRFSPG